MRWWRIKWACRHQLNIKASFDKNDFTRLVIELQSLYYSNKLNELKTRINGIDKNLSFYDSMALSKAIAEISMTLFKSSLYDHYAKHKRHIFTEAKDILRDGEVFFTAISYSSQHDILGSVMYLHRQTLRLHHHG